jgi:hypothetical protein
MEKPCSRSWKQKNPEREKHIGPEPFDFLPDIDHMTMSRH